MEAVSPLRSASSRPGRGSGCTLELCRCDNEKINRSSPGPTWLSSGVIWGGLLILQVRDGCLLGRNDLLVQMVGLNNLLVQMMGLI